jgi:general secretion pathway protein G
MAFTLLELIVTVAIVSIIATISMPIYAGYIERANTSQAIGDITRIEAQIERFRFDNIDPPDALSDVYATVPVDPWGNAYRYLRIAGNNTQGQQRKDHNLVPINSDYDLYSMGPDGLTVGPLTAPRSRDDILRANNGGFVGTAEDY